MVETLFANTIYSVVHWRWYAPYSGYKLGKGKIIHTKHKEEELKEDNDENILTMKKRTNISGRMPEYPLQKRKDEVEADVIEQIKVAYELLKETYGEIFERVKIKEDAPLKGSKLADALEEAGIDIPIEWNTKYIQSRHIYFIQDNNKVDTRGEPLSIAEA